MDRNNYKYMHLLTISQLKSEYNKCKNNEMKQYIKKLIKKKTDDINSMSSVYFDLIKQHEKSTKKKKNDFSDDDMSIHLSDSESESSLDIDSIGSIGSIGSIDTYDSSDNDKQYTKEKNIENKIKSKNDDIAQNTRLANRMFSEMMFRKENNESEYKIDKNKNCTDKKKKKKIF